MKKIEVEMNTGEFLTPADVATVSIVDTYIIKHTVKTTVEETSGIMVAAALAVNTDRENSVKITDTLRNMWTEIVSLPTLS